MCPQVNNKPRIRAVSYYIYNNIFLQFTVYLNCSSKVILYRIYYSQMFTDGCIPSPSPLNICELNLDDLQK